MSLRQPKQIIIGQIRKWASRTYQITHIESPAHITIKILTSPDPVEINQIIEWDENLILYDEIISLDELNQLKAQTL